MLERATIINITYDQGRNFGLKSGVASLPIQKENEMLLGPEARGEENGEQMSLPIRLCGLWERREIS